MRARYHGEPVATTSLTDTVSERFGFMFDTLADNPENRLAEGPDTIEALRQLGSAMALEPSNEESAIPAAFTYFGQFIDHDITLTEFEQPKDGPPVDIFNVIELPDFPVLRPQQVRASLVNRRTGALDLDSVYRLGAADGATDAEGRMVLGKVTEVPEELRPIKTADLHHDLPRLPPQQDQDLDRKAIIGDARNDENLIIAQMHVAFLRAHNALMQRDRLDARQARTALRRRYQWAVLHDFLPRICAPRVMEKILGDGASIWRADTSADLFMPIEFSAAAYRFGHSMVRQEYDYNATFKPEGGLAPATFNFLFTFTALSGDIQPEPGENRQFPSLPNNWIIDWVRFFDHGGAAGPNPARKIDARISPELGKLRDVVGIPIPSIMGRLAARNLLRGYLLGLPTGQAVAARPGVPRLSEAEILAAVPASNRARFTAAGFHVGTPLWFYVLAEAAAHGPDGNHLGNVGSTIVAETLWNHVRFAEDSVLANPPSRAELDTGEFTLRGLIRTGQDALLPPLG
jgi:hypothetical protein